MFLKDLLTIVANALSSTWINIFFAMNIGLHNAFCNIIHIIYLGNLYFCTDLSEFVVSLSLYITFLLNMASLLLMIFLFFLSPNQYPNSLVLYPIKITFLYFISSLLLASKSIFQVYVCT